jgi:hypothetical protein
VSVISRKAFLSLSFFFFFLPNVRFLPVVVYLPPYSLSLPSHSALNSDLRFLSSYSSILPPFVDVVESLPSLLHSFTSTLFL